MDEEKIIGRKLRRMSKQIFKEAYSRGVKIKKITNQKFKMSLGEREYTIRRGSFLSSVNPSLSKKVCDSKEVTSRLLRSRQFNAPENAVFSSYDLDRAWRWAQPILPIVLKPFNGKMGRLVFVNIDNYQDFRSCFIKISKQYDEILIEQFINGKEYRFTYIDNEIVAIAKRIPANVVGNGINTIEQLINKKNIQKEKNPIHKKIKVDNEVIRVLSSQGLAINDIPTKNELVFLRKTSNISTGGDAIDMTEEIDHYIKDYVRRAIRTINGIVICGADVLIDDSQNVTILEINPRPMISMHVYPWKGESRDVVTKFVDALFPNSTKKKEKDIDDKNYNINKNYRKRFWFC